MIWNHNNKTHVEVFNKIFYFINAYIVFFYQILNNIDIKTLIDQTNKCKISHNLRSNFKYTLLKQGIYWIKKTQI